MPRLSSSSSRTGSQSISFHPGGEGGCWPKYGITDILKIHMADSRSTVVVSARGQITLPADLRHRLGIKEGGVVTLEERNGVLVLRPAAVVELTMYSDENVARWDAEDKLSNAERRRVKKKLARKS